jgi:transposase
MEAQSRIEEEQVMQECSKYIGFDVHKNSITVALAAPGAAPPQVWGTIENSPPAVARLLKKLSRAKHTLGVWYEAGPCGYGIYRQVRSLGHACEVVAPSLIPRKSGVRVKTDGRDALQIVGQGRAGQLSAVWVPDESQEAMRDLTRAREDMKIVERQMKQRLAGFLLRQGRRYPGPCWTQAYFRWLEQQRFPTRPQQIVLEEYVAAVREATRRTTAVEAPVREATASWSLREAFVGVQALRGIDTLAAVTLLAELGDVSRFDNPRPLMGFVGLVASEYSSGARRRQGAITKCGNQHVRRMLVESAWAYRFPARKTARIQRRAEKTSPAVQAIAWKAQKRLCGRYAQLTARGKPQKTAVTAVARELCGFLWAIVRETMSPAAA